MTKSKAVSAAKRYLIDSMKMNRAEAKNILVRSADKNLFGWIVSMSTADCTICAIVNVDSEGDVSDLS